MSWKGFDLLLVLLELRQRWRWWVGFGFDLRVGDGFDYAVVVGGLALG
jgi:hypothetical protein